MCERRRHTEGEKRARGKEEKGCCPYFQMATRSRKLSRTFFTTHGLTHPTLNERDFFDFSATREAAGKKTNISVRFLYYFFNGLRLSKNASERDIAPFTPQRYNIPPTLSKHFPSLFPFFLPSPSASLLRPSASLFCQSISLFRQPAQ